MLSLVNEERRKPMAGAQPLRYCGPLVLRQYHQELGEAAAQHSFAVAAGDRGEPRPAYGLRRADRSAAATWGQNARPLVARCRPPAAVPQPLLTLTESARVWVHTTRQSPTLLGAEQH
jgi:hypothetical protein